MIYDGMFLAVEKLFKISRQSRSGTSKNRMIMKPTIIAAQWIAFLVFYLPLSGLSQGVAEQPTDSTKSLLTLTESEQQSTEPPYLGLVVDKITENTNGVQVLSVLLRGPAYRAGILPGDEIHSINEKKIMTLDNMAEALHGLPIGSSVKIHVIRNGQREVVDIELESRSSVSTGGWLNARPILGIRVETLRDSLRHAKGIVPQRGAIVTKIKPGSPAASAELPLGAVIVAVNNQSIVTANELVDHIRHSKPGDNVELTYYIGEEVVQKSVRLAVNTQQSITTLDPDISVAAGLPSVLPNRSPPLEPDLIMTNSETDLRLLQRTVDRLERQVQALQDQLGKTNQLLQEIKQQIGISDPKPQ